jgi:type VI secretion system FHA domain protein
MQFSGGPRIAPSAAVVRLILTLVGRAASVPDKDRMRTLSSGTLSIGRGSSNDWVLPDPDRHLSKTHCAIAIDAGRFMLTDLSTNGIFVNGAQQATERDSTIELVDGDEFRLGDYVISVAAVDDGPALAADSTSAGDARGPLDADLLDDPFGRRPDPAFPHPAAAPQVNLRGADPFDRDGERPRHVAGEDDDLFRGVAAASDWQGASRPDHVRATAQALPPPRVIPAALPGEIDFDALIGDLDPPGAAPPAPAAAPASAARDPFAEDGAERPAPPPAAPLPGAAAPARPPARGPDADAAFAAFLDGAGVLGHRIDDSDPEAALRAVGKVFRAMTEGLREVLLSRAAIKGEMRLERTMIAAHGNNGLKFAVTGEEAVISLLTSGRPGYMDPLAAAQEACTDIKFHELAVMAGVQTALLALLRRFDPSELEKRLTTGVLRSLLPAARKAQFWDLFRQTYADISREAEDDFQAVFGRSFAKAYAAQTRKE